MTEPVAQRSHAICDYEGTSYRANFWEGQGREYEDLAERIALQQLLPSQGRRLLEVGAGFGRLADLYGGYQQVVLLDYAQSGLREARERLGTSGRFLYVAADLYHLPLVAGACDTAVTVRVLHHVADIPAGLRSIAAAVKPGGTYVLEYANKRNLKSIVRYALGRQRWSPFDEAPVEFVELNYDFHPRWMGRELARAGFRVEAGRAVSHFRIGALKRLVPAPLLATLDGWAQLPGAVWKFSPSVFLRCRLVENRPAPAHPLQGDKSSKVEPAEGLTGSASKVDAVLRCLVCDGQRWREEPDALICLQCGTTWDIADGIYNFKEPRHNNGGFVK